MGTADGRWHLSGAQGTLRKQQNEGQPLWSDEGLKGSLQPRQGRSGGEGWREAEWEKAKRHANEPGLSPGA